MLKRGIILLCIILVFSFFVNADRFDGSVFVTNVLYGGDLGGLAGAHEICREEAENAGFNIGMDSGEWWKAWVSIEESEAKDFIDHNYAKWCTLNNPGLIDDDWNQLTDGNIDRRINCLANGQELGDPYQYVIYTATTMDGSFAGDNCNDFTSGSYGDLDSDFNVKVGSSGLTDGGWTYSSEVNCLRYGRIYCFRQTFDGDADKTDCGISEEGIWLGYESDCDLEECDTFHRSYYNGQWHDYQDYDGGFCCGDDEGEMFKRDSVYNNGLQHACCFNANSCVADGQCMSGAEGPEYDGTCSNELDDDCDGWIDNEDEDCWEGDELITRLTIDNPSDVCSDENNNYGVSLQLMQGSLEWDNVVIYDEIHDNNGLVNTESFSCETGPVCSESYSLSLGDGNYYHNVYAKEGVSEINRRNDYMGFDVYSLESVECCVGLGQAPTGDRVCCDGLPADNNGKCGCEPPTEWIEGKCQYPRASCYPIEECNINPIDNFAQWLATPGCFKNFLGIEGGDAPYEYACCPLYLEHDYDDEEGNDVIWSMNPEDIPDALIKVY